MDPDDPSRDAATPAPAPAVTTGLIPAPVGGTPTRHWDRPAPRRPLDVDPAPRRPRPHRPPVRSHAGDGFDDRNAGLMLALGAGALIGAGAAAYYARRKLAEGSIRPPDSAPRRTARDAQKREDGRSVTGRTVTIAKPRSEVYAFWHDHRNLPRVIENVKSVTREADGTYSWSIATLGDRTLEMRTRNVVEREGEEIRWVSTNDSSIDTEGQVTFRDAPADRGTEVTLTILYRLPGGELGRLAAAMLQRSPGIQARRSVKRLKMLMETGEIATGANRRADPDADSKD